MDRCKKQLDQKRHMLARINKLIKQLDDTFLSVQRIQGLAVKLESQSRKEVASVTVQELASNAVTCLADITCSPSVAKMVSFLSILCF